MRGLSNPKSCQPSGCPERQRGCRPRRAQGLPPPSPPRGGGRLACRPQGLVEEIAGLPPFGGCDHFPADGGHAADERPMNRLTVPTVGGRLVSPGEDGLSREPGLTGRPFRRGLQTNNY